MKRNPLIPVLSALLLFSLSLAAAESNHTHREARVYTPSDEACHTVSVYCADPDCGMELSRYEEEHQFSEGACSRCGYACPHAVTHTESIPVEGEDDYSWDGAYLTYTVLKVTCCETCGQELSRKLGEERLLHETHTDPVHLSYTYENENSHTEKLSCSLCGTVYSVSKPHQWTRAGYCETDSWAAHTVILHCSQCRAVLEKTEQHSLREARWEKGEHETCIQVMQCTECGKEVRMPPVDHDYSNARYIIEEDGHGIVEQCARCAYSFITLTYPHTYKNGVCTVCGAKYDWKHEHEASFDDPVYTSFGAQGHYRFGVCRLCGMTLPDPRREGHSYDPVTGVCVSCGYARDGHAHEVKLICNEALSDDERHVFSGVCSVCGITVAQSGEHKPADKAYEKLDNDTCLETGVCSVCGRASVKRLPHATDMAMLYDSETHWRTCKNCRCRVDEAEHTYTERDGKLYCDACGYEREAPAPHEHQLVFRYAIPGDRMSCRWVYTCSECGLDFCEYHDHEPVGNPEYQSFDDERHTARFLCRYCGRVVTVYGAHTLVNDMCVDCGSVVHIHRFEEYSSTVDPHLYYYQCRCGKIDREERTPCELQSRYRVLSETQHEFLYECVLCAAVKGRSTENHIFVNGICETCGYVQGTDIPVENDALPGVEEKYAPAVVSLRSGEEELTLRGSLLLPWRVLAINGTLTECLPEVSLPEGETKPVCLFRPEGVPEDGLYEMLLTRGQMEDLVFSGVGSLRVEINGFEITVLSDAAEALRRMEEEEAEELMIFFCLDPDAPQGAHDTSAYLFTSAPFELFEAEKEQPAGL